MRALDLRSAGWAKAFVPVVGVLAAAWSTGCSPSHEEPQQPKDPPAFRSLGPSHQEPPVPNGEQQPGEESPSQGKAGKGPESGAAKPASAWTHQLARTAEYYKDGPQQMRPPDGKLPAGTKVRVLREAGSYTLVESESGVTAYVAADALKPLAP